MAKLLQTQPEIFGRNILPESVDFSIKRVFWISHISTETVRGKHRHKKSIHFLVCLTGSCKVYINNGQHEEVFLLDHPSKILYLVPEDWREMYDFSKDCRLFCFSNEHYDPNDYIYTPYPFTVDT